MQFAIDGSRARKAGERVEWSVGEKAAGVEVKFEKAESVNADDGSGGGAGSSPNENGSLQIWIPQ